MNYNIKELLESKNGHAFIHIQDKFWLTVITESLEFTNGSITEASERLGITKATFRTWCSKLGVSFKDFIKRPVGEEQAINEALDSTSNLIDAAEKLGIHKDTLRKRMFHYGIEPRGKRMSHSEYLSLSEVFKKQGTIAKTARYLKADPSTICKKLKRAGIVC